MKRLTRLMLLGATVAMINGPLHAADSKTIYEQTCAACHASGAAGAPKTGDVAAWQQRFNERGYGGLTQSAVAGRGAMPAKGGNAALSEDDVRVAVMYILQRSLAQQAAAGAATAAPESRDAKSASQRKEATPAKAQAASAADTGKGQSTYQATCSACHNTGAAGAPKLGDRAAWSARTGGGAGPLYESALKGKGAMPAKGGNAALADNDVKAAVDYMLAQAGGASTRPAASAAQKTETPTKQPTAAATVAAAGGDAKGKSVYQATCATCHASGLANAPKFGDATAWAARVKTGSTALYATALNGKGGMPAKGGNASLSEADVRAAVDYMVAAVGGSGKSAEAQTASATKPAAPAPKAETPSDTKSATAGAATPPAPAVAASPPAAATAVAAVAATSDVNAFNRLMRAPGKRNLPPTEDGIHDPQNDGTVALQAPLAAYANFPKSNAGNRVDWVKSLGERHVAPRADKQDAKTEMTVLDLNIVREVKGSMPDVVYPHKQHTQWLDCSNCHPAIFIPQKGANQISMASILLGQKCGVCHGKVAFPVSECRLCHSKPKDVATAATGGTKP